MITSVANREVRALRRLRTRENRERLGLLLVEGRFAITEALAAGGLIDRIVTTPRGQRLHAGVVRDAVAAGARKIAVDETVMGAICDTAAPPSLLAVARIPRVEATAGERFVWLVVGDVRDPGALGMILRTAAAFGVGLVAVLPGCADPFAAKVVRAAAGAHWRLAIEHPADLGALLARGAEHGATTVVLDEGVIPARAGLPDRMVLVTTGERARLDSAMRLEGTSSRPGLPASSILPIVLADWARIEAG